MTLETITLQCDALRKMDKVPRFIVVGGKYQLELMQVVAKEMSFLSKYDPVKNLIEMSLYGMPIVTVEQDIFEIGL